MTMTLTSDVTGTLTSDVTGTMTSDMTGTMTSDVTGTLTMQGDIVEANCYIVTTGKRFVHI